jgi:hypothetical protein
MSGRKRVRRRDHRHVAVGVCSRAISLAINPLFID